MKNRIVKNKKLLYEITFVLIVILFGAIYIINSYYFISKTNCKYKVGIIDGSLSREYNNVIFSSGTSIKNKNSTHGDEMIKFAQNCQDNLNLFYYDASDSNSKINDNRIIKGLNWMVTNNVEKVNLSLSTKIKSDKLEKWIKNHSQIKVYVSYNNRLNTFDYPAMYSGTYASGSNSKINYKKTDIKYKTSKIILIKKNHINIYHGNSYLSVLSMLKDMK